MIKSMTSEIIEAKNPNLKGRPLDVLLAECSQELIDTWGNIMLPVRKEACEEILILLN